MHTWGRTYNEDGTYQWVKVSTDASGQNDNVYATTVCQVLKLSRNESPIFSNYGIPAQQSVTTQIPPDVYVAQTQQQFAPHFASLTIQRLPGSPLPSYAVGIIAHNGAILDVGQVPM
jgi:hypothetical protein